MPVRTEFELGVKTKGFAKAQQDTRKIREEVRTLESRLGELAKKQLEVNKAMDKVGSTASPAYKKLASDLKKVTDETTRLERAAGALTRAFNLQGQAAERAARQGAFTQGLLQGALPSAFLQRGPGMMRQAAGVAIGQGARQMAGGLGATAFQGLGGLQQAMAGIPIVGGAMAGMLGTAAGFGQQALGMQRQELSSLAVLGGGGPAAQRVLAARQIGMSDADIARQANVARAAGRAESISAREVRRSLQPRTRLGGGALGADFAGAMAAAESQTERESRVNRRMGELREQRGEQRAEETVKGLRDIRAQERGRAVGAIRQRLFGGIQGAGMELMGAGRQEAMQRATQAIQVGGGSLADLRQQGLLRTGFAAQTAFGIGADVTGAFLQAGRAGGAVGAGGRGGAAMTDAISDAMKMGLEGSEVNEYLQQMAAGINSWKQTGIPINSRSISSMGRTLGGLGLGAIRGGRVAAGVSAAAQRLSVQGPQTAADLLMFQELGGFQGGGITQFEQAQARLEEGGFGAQEMQRMMQRFMDIGGEGPEGRARGRFAFRGAMRRMGVDIGVRETQIMEKQLRGEKLTREEDQRIRQFEEKAKEGAELAPKTPKQLQEQSAALIDAFGNNLKRQAGIQNEQLEVGKKMLPIIQDMSNTTTKVAESFQIMAGGPMESVTGSINKMAEALPKVATRLVQYAEGEISFTDLLGGIN